MPQKSAKAADAVAALLKSKPKASMDDLFAEAGKADRKLANMPRRSFNATYVLPLKRAQSKKTGRRATAKKRPAKRSTRRRTSTRVRLGERARIAARNLVLERDQQVVTALNSNGDPRQAYELAANVDAYVDRLALALRK